MTVDFQRRVVFASSGGMPAPAPAPAPVVPPTPGRLSLWVDASNYTGTLIAQSVADLKAAGVQGVIVQAITGMDGQTYTRQQLQACADAGLRIMAYVWCFPGASVAGRLPMLDGFKLEALWLDVEQTGLLPVHVDRDLALCDAYTDRKTGIYTAKWFFDAMGWTHQSWWADRPLWDASYNHIPEVGATFVPYGGWTRPVMSQFEGTSSLGSVHQIDLDVLEGS